MDNFQLNKLKMDYLKRMHSIGIYPDPCLDRMFHVGLAYELVAEGVYYYVCVTCGEPFLTTEVGDLLEADDEID